MSSNERRRYIVELIVAFSALITAIAALINSVK
ncbi:hypothetical protein SAMN02194393_05181 [Maledivibacter halophilus]|uniref:Uncharacterized protein n=1 Tax=Maledivibacter halophilus TaxID=36842 RepID=A0A1T5MR75_9FIRM|nr:hypothetical protein SAMN02194393_05181 [Maledivibacter halophilus]